MGCCVETNGLSIFVIPNHPVTQAYIDIKKRSKIKIHPRTYQRKSTISDWTMVWPAESNILLLNRFKLFPIVFQRLHSRTVDWYCIFVLIQDKNLLWLDQFKTNE
jgi:hypothetical protein